MRTITRFRVAEQAHTFTLDLYRATKAFPQEETYGLQSQLRRASVSIGSNIAEGDHHQSNRVFLRHLSIAVSSSGEVEYQLLLARDLGYLPEATYQALVEQVVAIRQMLIRLMDHVRARPALKT